MIKIFSKKTFAILIAVMLVLQVLVPAYAVSTITYYCSECGENGVLGNLLHTIDPTCSEDGFDIYECDYVKPGDSSSSSSSTAAVPCEGTITLRVVATGQHVSNGILVEEIPAECEKTGVMAHENCEDCGVALDPETGKELTDLTIPVLGHKLPVSVTQPDCVNDGYISATCERCGWEFKQAGAPALGHDFQTVPGKDATCREEGWTEYKACSRCGLEDPDNKKQILPIEDHNGRYIESEYVAETCLTDGRRVFGCKKDTCPYYYTEDTNDEFDGVEEIINEITPNEHDIINVPQKDATCDEDGHKAYEKCSRCDYTTYSDNLVLPALGHTEVNIGYKAPTCTEDGMTDAVVCDRCGKVHHPGEVIPALGHEFDDVAALEADCMTEGLIAHRHCTVCGLNFAPGTEDKDFDAVALEKVTIDKIPHVYHEWFAPAPDCTNGGWKVYSCTNILTQGDRAGEECKHTYSEELAALGHKFEFVPQEDPDCVNPGKKAHNKCTVEGCGLIFAADADPMANPNPITGDDLVIDPLGHKPVDVEFVAPTYDKDGNEAGKKCGVCGEPLEGAGKLDELEEGIKFWYDIKGVGYGSDKNAHEAVNSGYIKLNIYFDVLAAANDKEEYNSDVLANLFGVDFAMNFDKDVFELTDVAIAEGTFADAAYTELDDANDNGLIKITQDMVDSFKTFRGTNNHFATLTFQVAADAEAGNYNFGLENLLLVHPDAEEINDDVTETGVQVDVLMLGDADKDGVLTSKDSKILSDYCNNMDLDKKYFTEYDMDKDGDIDFIDLGLLRNAIADNDYYLDITVDPNA